MELFQVLHKNIPQKNKIFALFSKQQQQQDISKFLLQTIKTMKREVKDIRALNSFFIEFYDMMYHHIVFRRVKVEKRVVRVLEALALSSEQVGEEKRSETFKRVRKMKL